MTNYGRNMQERVLHKMQKESGYILQKKDVARTIRDKDYTFGITVVVCAESGEVYDLFRNPSDDVRFALLEDTF